MTMEATDAIDLCERILSDLDEIPERGWNFAESVRTKVDSIKASAREPAALIASG